MTDPREARILYILSWRDKERTLNAITQTLEQRCAEQIAICVELHENGCSIKDVSDAIMISSRGDIAPIQIHPEVKIRHTREMIEFLLAKEDNIDVYLTSDGAIHDSVDPLDSTLPISNSCAMTPSYFAHRLSALNSVAGYIQDLAAYLEPIERC